MIKSLLVLSCSIICSNLFSQQPQFAVVRPNGTTYICPTWDSAYNKAQDGDDIYLPGVTIPYSLTIDKRLNIFGAGHHPDSSQATGKTSLANSSGIFIRSGASGGSIEGIQVPSGQVYFDYSGRRIQNYTISRCRINGNIQFKYNSLPDDSLPINVGVNESIIYNTQGFGSSGIRFTKNVIDASINGFNSSYFANNIFIHSGYHSGISNSQFHNNIFLSGQSFYGENSLCTNSFYNNVKLQGGPFLATCPVNTGIEVNTISEASASDIFLSFQYPAGHPYTNNYHLKPTSFGKNAGTDGTDVGIYGTSQPTSEGWVPSNPHIYFKQVDAQTGSDGKLRVQFKVRTNN